MIDKEFVVSEYTSGKTPKEIAKTIGCSDEGVRKILRNNGFSLRQKKHCPAIVGMLTDVLGMSTTEIASCCSIPIQSVNNILTRKYSHLKQSRIYAKDIDMDALEAEYLAGATTYELGEKHGVNHATISRWMTNRGNKRGKRTDDEWCSEQRCKHRKRAIERDKQRLLDEGGKIELVEYGGQRSTYRCTDCGLVFTRQRGYKNRAICPDCYEREIAEQKAINDARREEERKKAEQVRAEEYAKDKVCVLCGSVFHSEYPTARFCSEKCKTKDKINKKLARDRKKTAIRQAEEIAKDKVCACCGSVFHSIYESKIYCDKCAVRYNNCNHRLRAKKYGVDYEPGITLDKLIKRDGNICQICGEPCDKNDHSWGNGIGPLYPTQDHIIAMAKGGGHVWSNMQLAHALCNAIKSDRDEEELTEEVIAHAKEQAIAHKCA